MGATATGTGATAGVAAGTAAGSAAAGGTFATGAAALAGGYGATAAVVGGAVGAFAGSVASQAVGSAMGVTSFSWRNAVQAGVSAGLTAGLANTSFMQGINGALQGSRFAQGAATAVMGQLSSYAASQIAGVDASFSWRRIAVSSVSAGLTSAAMPKIGPALGIDLTTRGGQFASDMVGGVVGGTIAMHASRKFGFGGDIDYGRVVSDAFGNTLGNAVSGKHAQWTAEAAAQVDRDYEQQRLRNEAMSAAAGMVGQGMVGHPALMLLGGGQAPNVPGTYSDGAYNMDTVQATPASNGWAFWSWNMHHNQWVDVSYGAVFNRHQGHVDPVVQHWSRPDGTGMNNAYSQFTGELAEANARNTQWWQQSAGARVMAGMQSSPIADRLADRGPQMSAPPDPNMPLSLLAQSRIRKAEYIENNQHLEDRVGNMLAPFAGRRYDNGTVNGQLVNPFNDERLSASEQQVAMMDMLGLVSLPMGGVRTASSRIVSTGRVANNVDNVWHATKNARAAQGVLDGIDPKFLNANSRFGAAFYVAERPGTALAEIAHHGTTPTTGIRFSIDRGVMNVLDLTDPKMASAWGYNGGPISSATQAIGAEARLQGFNAIRYYSERAPGTINYAVLDNYNQILKPVMVTPVKP